MNTINIQIDGKNHVAKMPSSWHELTTDELIYIIRLLSAQRPFFIEDIEDMPQRKLNIFMAFLRKNKLDDALVAEWKAIRDAEFDNEYSTVFLSELDTLITTVTQFLFTTIQRGKKKVEVLTPDLLRCPVPTLRIPTKRGDRILHAPSCGRNAKSLDPLSNESLKNISIYELGQTFTLYENWTETGDDDTLNTLIATLYREKKPDSKQNRATNYEGDVRLPLRGYEATIPQRKDLIARNVPTQLKEIIAYWFGSCRHHFAATYPDVFSAPSGNDDNRFGYAGIILELSRATHEGKNAIADQNAHSTMVELQYEIHRAKSQNTEGV